VSHHPAVGPTFHGGFHSSKILNLPFRILQFDFEIRCLIDDSLLCAPNVKTPHLLFVECRREGDDSFSEATVICGLHHF
jgi:hypothetical protein